MRTQTAHKYCVVSAYTANNAMKSRKEDTEDYYVTETLQVTPKNYVLLGKKERVITSLSKGISLPDFCNRRGIRIDDLDTQDRKAMMLMALRYPSDILEKMKKR